MQPTTNEGARTAAATPLACVPGAIPAAERGAHFALIERLLGTRLRERRALETGYALRFDADAFDDLARWLGNERRCCPFLTIALELAPDGGPVWVRLTGPEGTRDFLDAEIPALATTLSH
jgi:hypothetical protein